MLETYRGYTITSEGEMLDISFKGEHVSYEPDIDAAYYVIDSWLSSP